MAVTQPRPTHIPCQYAKFADDRALYNVIFDVCKRLTCKMLIPIFRYFGILCIGY